MQQYASYGRSIDGEGGGGGGGDGYIKPIVKIA